MESSGAEVDVTKKPVAAESDRPNQRSNLSTLGALTTKNVWSVSGMKECYCYSPYCCSSRSPRKGNDGEGKGDEEDMDVELWSSLPQAMVEEVLARVPLKLLFQCRVLSRAWRWGGSGRTPSGSEFGQQPQVGRDLVHPFEKAIFSVSSRWPSYCPVYIFQEGLVGYNSQSKTWETLFDLKMFPSLPEGIDASIITSCAGALVCFASVHFHNAGEMKERDSSEWLSWKPLDYEVYVVNVVTKKWKRLPHRPNMQRPSIMHLTHVGSTDYEIILLTQISGVANIMVTQIYSSVSKTWTQKSSKSVLPTWRTSLSNYVYLDGVFYIATGSSSPIDPPLLMTHNVELGTWNTMIPPLPILWRKLVKYHVLLCGSELVLVVRVLGVDGGLEDEEDEALRPSFYKDVFVRNHSFLIYKLDLTTGQMKQVSRCPREKLIGVSIDQILAFGDSIYFGGRYIPKTPMMMYNVRKQEWSYHTSAWEMPKPRQLGSNLCFGNGYYTREPEHFYWTHSALQPGLNPFAHV